MSHLRLGVLPGPMVSPLAMGVLGVSACPREMGVECPKCPSQVCELVAPTSSGRLIRMVRLMSMMRMMKMVIRMVGVLRLGLVRMVKVVRIMRTMGIGKMMRLELMRVIRDGGGDEDSKSNKDGEAGADEEDTCSHCSCSRWRCCVMAGGTQ